MLDNRSVAVMRINHTKFPLAKIVYRLEVKDGLDLWHIVVCRHDDGCTLYLVGVCFLELDVVYLVALDGFGWLRISLLSFEPFKHSFILGATTIPQALLLHWTTGA